LTWKVKFGLQNNRKLFLYEREPTKVISGLQHPSAVTALSGKSNLRQKLNTGQTFRLKNLDNKRVNMMNKKQAKRISENLHRQGGPAEQALRIRCERERKSRLDVIMEWGDPKKW